VVADINRYAATPLRLADPAIAHLPYSGTVRTDAIGEWVSALPYAFPVKVRYRRDGVEIAPAPLLRLGGDHPRRRHPRHAPEPICAG
jgi:transmembrane sensor